MQYLGKWESFMNAISPVSSKVPYMVQQGNHEQDWANTGTIGSGTGPELGRDSGGECGVPTSARFIMPNATAAAAAAAAAGAPGAAGAGADGTRKAKAFHDDPYWYSFDAGPVHFTMVNTELPLMASTGTGGKKGPPSPQWSWLAADLKATDRTRTPWIVVMGHRPSIFTESSVEALLWEHGVDLTVAVSGHVAGSSQLAACMLSYRCPDAVS